MISFFVDGLPKAAPRPRRAKSGHFYVPPTDRDWKTKIGWVCRGLRTAGPVALRLDFHLPAPKRAQTRCGSPHTSKPDLDNLTKSVMDALTNVGTWIDDSQVYDLRVTKHYAARPGVTITIVEGGYADDRERKLPVYSARSQ